MPETPHHAFEVHISLSTHLTGSVTEELTSYLKGYTLWHALKHELGDNGKLHAHIAIVKEIASAEPDPKAGATTASNMKRHLLRRCPKLQDLLNDNKYGMVTAPMKSDVLIAEYLQKEGDLVYVNLPADLAELTPYFADLQKAKPKNTDYTDWSNMYEKDKCEFPATHETVWAFLCDHMYVVNDMKVVADKKRLMERCEALTAFINKEIPEMPSAKRARAEEPKERYCPNGRPWCQSFGPLAKYRKQCDGCNDYK